MERDISKKRKYSFRKYSKACTMLFFRERGRLTRCLGKTAYIEHVGSTAVPGLGGKNILDIMLGDTPHHFKKRIKQLSGIGYVFHPENGSSERFFFVRDTKYKGKNIRIHLHLTNLKSREWKEMLAFRDYLRANRKAAIKYAAIKRKAARNAKGDKKIYMKEKEGFIQNTIRNALAR